MSDKIDSLDWRRVGLLLRYDIWMRRREIRSGLIWWGITYAVLELVFGFALGSHRAAVVIVYFFALFSGWVYTANEFTDFHSRHNAPFYLMFPASAAEKISARWILTALAYPLAVALVGTILYQVSYLLDDRPSTVQLTVGPDHHLAWANGWTFLPFGGAGLLLTYLAVHAIVFWGAVRFLQSPLGKTFAAAFCVALYFWIGRAFLGVLWLAYLDDNSQSAFKRILKAGGDQIETVSSTLFWFVLPPGMILLAYRHLRRAEA